MLLHLPSPETLYAALLARDPAYEGHAFVGVTTTGIFCRLTCPAQNPKFENTRFYDSIAACLEAGFRPCLRCRPLDLAGDREPLVASLLTRLEQDPSRLWSEDDLVAMGMDPSTVRRAFRRHIGITFLDLARLRRTGRGLASGSEVIDAPIQAGFNSGSGVRDAVARLIGDSPAALHGRDLLKADCLETPIGAMLAVADQHALHVLEFSDRQALATELTRVRKATQSSITFGRLPPIDRIEAELAAYFAGTLQHFTTPLVLHGTSFTREVWDQLIAIPFGTTRSYGQLAASIEQPTAVRAVARANGANQISIAIPCHRVIGWDGSLTGYGGGLWRKRWLLEHERRFAGNLSHFP